MSQSRKGSLAESLVNVLIGYGVGVVSQMAVFPLLGITVAFGQNLAIGGFFTIISIARSYALRRVFNWWHTTEDPLSRFARGYFRLG